MQKNKKPTITIGIPAYNEEANIVFLLEDLIRLNTTGLNLEKILVLSDGSSDKTVNNARLINSKIIEVLEDGQRKGLAERQNEMFERTSSDVLVILNADTRVKDTEFLHKISEPLVKGSADFVSSRTQEVSPNTFMEKVLFASMAMKRSMFERIRGGETIYTCYGVARAFSRRYYAKVRFPFSVGEDAYSYLIAKKLQLKYQYVNSTCVFYKLPELFLDHEKQRSRFLHSQDLLVSLFGKEHVKGEYRIPKDILINETIQAFIKHPLFIGIYLLISLSVLLKHKAHPHKNENYWQSSKSSKKVIFG